MIVKILIALANPEFGLFQQLLERERYTLRIAIVDTLVRQCLDEMSLPFNIAQW